jgi:hypothetical protein
MYNGNKGDVMKSKSRWFLVGRAIDPRRITKGLIWLTDGAGHPYIFEEGGQKFALCFDQPDTRGAAVDPVAIWIALFRRGWLGHRFESLCLSPEYWDEVLANGAPTKHLVVLRNPHLHNNPRRTNATLRAN